MLCATRTRPPITRVWASKTVRTHTVSYKDETGQILSFFPSHVDAGAPARRLDFFRRFEAGEITVAYSTEWHRLVNLPETESEDEAPGALDDDEASEASDDDEADASVKEDDEEEEIDALLNEPSEEELLRRYDIQGVTRASLGLDSKLVASAGLLFALVAAGAWDLGAARATGFAAVVTAIAWVFVL